MFSSVAANLTNTNRMAVEVRSKLIFLFWHLVLLITSYFTIFNVCQTCSLNSGFLFLYGFATS